MREMERRYALCMTRWQESAIERAVWRTMAKSDKRQKQRYARWRKDEHFLHDTPLWKALIARWDADLQITSSKDSYNLSPLVSLLTRTIASSQIASPKDSRCSQSESAFGRRRNVKDITTANTTVCSLSLGARLK